jgi:hypothetical protein
MPGYVHCEGNYEHFGVANAFSVASSMSSLQQFNLVDVVTTECDFSSLFFLTATND